MKLLVAVVGYYLYSREDLARCSMPEPTVHSL